MQKPKLKRKYIQNDLFKAGPHTSLNACVGTNGGPYNFGDYSTGYFEAGKRLSKSILEDNWYADVLVYPLVFTYRHAIELGIKHLGSMIPKIYDDKSKIKFTHDLEDNWKTVRTYLERDKNFGGRDLVKQINKILRDFLHIDPTGEAFRYPIARVGSAFLQDTSIINIEIFAKTMIYVAETFEYWFDMVDEYWVAKCEVEHHS